MIEQLLAHIDNLEEKFNESGETINHIGDLSRKNFDCKYGLLINLKRFVLENMLPYFIDKTAESLRGYNGDNFLVLQEREKLSELVSRYEDYLDITDVMDYFDREIQARFLEVKAEREAQRKYLKKKNETQMQ